MYHAVKDILPEIETLGLAERLLPAGESKSPEYAWLMGHVCHCSTVQPFEPQVHRLLQNLREPGLTLGVITNRDREFLNTNWPRWKAGAGATCSTPWSVATTPHGTSSTPISSTKPCKPRALPPVTNATP